MIMNGIIVKWDLVESMVAYVFTLHFERPYHKKLHFSFPWDNLWEDVKNPLTNF